MSKSGTGNFFEDFRLGQELRHGTPRTLTEGDGAVYMSLFGPRFALQSADTFAMACGLPQAPLDDLLTFHTVFGKTVPDISLNAVANLGYADCRFLGPAYPGDTLQAVSTVIGLKENSNARTGVVYVRSTGLNQADEPVLDFVRWVMVRKRDPQAPPPEPVVPDLPARVAPERLSVPADLDFSLYDDGAAGARHRFEDYAVGERIDHRDGVTIEEAEHQMATRLFQNTARVHFNQHVEGQGRFGRRLVYGGYVISIARSLSFNGLGNACLLAAINGGRHVAPCFSGNTIYAWSEVLEMEPVAGRDDIGALRLRTIAAKDRDCAGFPGDDGQGGHAEGVVLDLDYWALIPRRQRP